MFSFFSLCSASGCCTDIYINYTWNTWFFLYFIYIWFCFGVFFFFFFFILSLRSVLDATLVLLAFLVAISFVFHRYKRNKFLAVQLIFHSWPNSKLKLSQKQYTGVFRFMYIMRLSFHNTWNALKIIFYFYSHFRTKFQWFCRRLLSSLLLVHTFTSFQCTWTK